MTLNENDCTYRQTPRDSEVKPTPEPFKGIGQRPRLSAEEMEAFKKSEHCSVTLSGPLEPAPAFLGDAQGKRPFRIGISASWPDNVTGPLDAASPFQRNELMERLWFDKRERAKRYLTELPRHLDEVSKSTRGDWRVLNHGVDIIDLVIGMQDFAKSLGMTTLDDEEMLTLIRQLVARNK